MRRLSASHKRNSRKPRETYKKKGIEYIRDQKKILQLTYMENLSAQIPAWNVYKKIAFRFSFILFILFIILLDYNNTIFSWLIFYFGQFRKPLDIVIFWIGKHIFHISYTIVSPAIDEQHNDRTYIYLLYFTIAAVAVTGAVVWSALDRKRTNYTTLYYWFTAILRYYLAFTLFVFAMEKFFKMQFPDLGYYRLTEPLGDMSPMGLAWAFFGYSEGYNYFIGIAEAAALFLLFRRTMTFGAILTLATLANVAVVNYNYDIHAKMYPAALLVITIFLLLNDAKRVFKFFFTGQANPLPVIQAPVFKKRWQKISKAMLKFLVIGIHIILIVVVYWNAKKHREETYKVHSGFYGVYDVTAYIVNKDTLSNENPLRWNQLVIGDMIEGVRFKGDSIAFADVSIDKKEILLSGDQTDLYRKMQEIYNENGNYHYPNVDSILIARQIKSRIVFELSGSNTLKLRGKIKNDSVFITAKRSPLEIKNFRLMKRHSHWINEASYIY